MYRVYFTETRTARKSLQSLWFTGSSYGIYLHGLSRTNSWRCVYRCLEFVECSQISQAWKCIWGMYTGLSLWEGPEVITRTPLFWTQSDLLQNLTTLHITSILYETELDWPGGSWLSLRKYWTAWFTDFLGRLAWLPKRMYQLLTRLVSYQPVIKPKKDRAFLPPL